MLAINTLSSTKATATLTPNILPCKIHHNGPIPTPKRYWNPTSSSNPSRNTTTSRDPDFKPTQTQTSYLRGRKLLGHSIYIPSGYEGVVLQKTDKTLPQPRDEKEDEEDEEEPVEVNVMEQTGRFNEIVVWGHEMIPDEEDAYRKGIEEWMDFAESIHAYDAPSNDKT